MRKFIMMVLWLFVTQADAYSSDVMKITSLPQHAYSSVGNSFCCRVINGMLEVASSQSEKRNVVAKMTEFAGFSLAAGFCTFDAADVYSEAEQLIGLMNKGNFYSPISKECQYFTKWTPLPKAIDRRTATEAVDRALMKTKRETIDLLQLNWWDYDNFYYYNAVGALMELQEEGKIQNLGLTNFDAEHLRFLLDENAPIVSNQVPFSIIDSRPKELMIPLCEERNVKLLCYGCLLGGFISPYWIQKPAPSEVTEEILNSPSLRKYLTFIKLWGSWDLFQDLLLTLQSIAGKYHLPSLSLVALKWVLQQSECVASVIVGSKFNQQNDHLQENLQLFSFTLDKDDMEKIESIQQRSNMNGKAVFDKYGDCGNEFRQPSKLKKKKYTPILL